MRRQLDRPLVGYILANLLRFAFAILLGVAILGAISVVLNVGAAKPGDLSIGDVIGAYVFALFYYIVVGVPLAIVYLFLLRRLRESVGRSRPQIVVGATVTGVVFILLLFGTSVLLLGPAALPPLIPWILFGALIRPPSVEPAAPVTSRP
jgi:hypothetical protein